MQCLSWGPIENPENLNGLVVSLMAAMSKEDRRRVHQILGWAVSGKSGPVCFAEHLKEAVKFLVSEVEADFGPLPYKPHRGKRYDWTSDGPVTGDMANAIVTFWAHELGGIAEDQWREVDGVKSRCVAFAQDPEENWILFKPIRKGVFIWRSGIPVSVVPMAWVLGDASSTLGRVTSEAPRGQERA